MSSDFGWLVLSYGVVAVGIVFAVILNKLIADPVLSVKDDFSVFTLLFITAQAIERVLEPVASWVKVPGGSHADKVQAKQKMATAAARGSDEDMTSEKEKVDRINANRALVMWALASFLGLVLSGALSLSFLSAVVDFSDSDSIPAGFKIVDIIITGIVIGSGTKPLHDLIARIEKAKESA